MRLKEFGIASIFFLLLTFIFSYKIFFGLIPLPADLIVGAYHPWLERDWEGYPLGVPIKNTKLSDAVSIYYPLKALAANHIKSGQLPLWNPYMFAGYPLFANPQLGLLFPTMIFYLLFPTSLGWTFQTISQPFLAGIFMFVLLRHLKLNFLPSIFGGIAYGFGGFTILWMQWNTHATTSMFLPILLFFEDKYLFSKHVKWGVLFSVFLCLQIFAGYLPVLPPTLLCLGLWYLFRSKNYIKDLSIGFFFVLGVLLSAVFILPVAELVLNSQRGVETLSNQNPFTHPINFLTLLAPDFFGNDATGNFWGTGDHMDSTLYIGITTLLFSIIGVKRFFQKREIKFALTILVLAVLFSIENPVSLYLYDHGVWGGTTITMNRINFVINFSLALLAGFGLSTLKNIDGKFSLKPALWILAGVVGIAFGLFFSKYQLNKWIYLVQDGLVADFNNALGHINISTRNLYLPLAIATTLFISFLIIKFFKGTRRFVQVLFIIILIAELFRFGWKFNTFSEKRFIFPETTLTTFLRSFPNDRIISELDILPANMWVPFEISSVAGYDGLYPLRMAKLLAVANSDNPDALPLPRWGVLKRLNSGVLEAVNTRFVIASKLEKGELSPAGKVNGELQLPNLKEVFVDKTTAVLENQESLPRAYTTKRVIKASDKEILGFLIDKTFPLEYISLSEELDFENPLDKPLKSEINYREVANSHIRINTLTNQDAYLVVLDGFYPGWKAFIDGNETKIYRTNFDFKGILLPKGEHVVDFRYQPKSLFFGGIITGISLSIILFLTAPILLKRVKVLHYLL